MRFKALLLASWLGGLAQTAGAMGFEPVDGLILRGFGTFGLARSSAPGAEYLRDLSQANGLKDGRWSGRIDSILGVQLNWQLHPEWELVGQIVSRLRYDRSHTPEPMWAFARWEPDPRLAIRIGRIGADFMMLADSRLVGYSYLPVRPPPDFFGPLFFSHFDGADVAVSGLAGDQFLRAKAFAGHTQEKTAGSLGVWDTSGSAVRGLVLDYQKGPWQIRANWAEIRFSHDMNIAAISDPLRAWGLAAGDVAALRAADSLTTAGKASRFAALGLVYEQGPLQIQAMVNHIRHETRIFQDSTAAFFLVGYRIGAWTPFAGVSRWKTLPAKDVQSIANPGLDEAYRQFIAVADIDRRTTTLGLRWDFRPQQALKLQWDHVRAPPGSFFSFANVDPGWRGRTDVLSITFDFVF